LAGVKPSVWQSSSAVWSNADAAGRVVLLDGVDELRNGKLQLAGQIFQRVGFSARKYGGMNRPRACWSMIE
jgi:hypothetical protein